MFLKYFKMFILLKIGRRINFLHSKIMKDVQGLQMGTTKGTRNMIQSSTIIYRRPEPDRVKHLLQPSHETHSRASCDK